MTAPGRGWFAHTLQAHWWRSTPSWLAQGLRPLSWLYRLALGSQRLPYRAGWRAARSVPVPVVVVGNMIVGGAGKTPTVIALVQALRGAGWHPGVVSRGYGGSGADWLEVEPSTPAARCGDEPALIARITAVPVWVGKRRAQVACMLCAANPGVDVIVSDDGLQHLDLARDLEFIVFDERGAGNGLCLPAGPLREPLKVMSNDNTHVLYNAARASTPLPGEVIQRKLGKVSLLHDWLVDGQRSGLPVAALKGQALWAAAGIASPQRFFSMLEEAGLEFHRLPLPDHHDYTRVPWPSDASDVIVTEKDAVKLSHLAGQALEGATRIWVAALDFQLPPKTLAAVLERLTELHRQ